MDLPKKGGGGPKKVGDPPGLCPNAAGDCGEATNRGAGASISKGEAARPRVPGRWRLVKQYSRASRLRPSRGLCSFRDYMSWAFETSMGAKRRGRRDGNVSKGGTAGSAADFGSLSRLPYSPSGPFRGLTH